MLTFENLKIELIKRNLKFSELVKKDGRSYQYLHKECSNGNQKVLSKLFGILYRN